MGLAKDSFTGTIEENIEVGAEKHLSSVAFDTITGQAQLTDLISSLPESGATQVGSGGTALSGGQKQRVAFARAIAQDAPILLLDEATSAVDSQSEHLIQKALREGSQGKSVIAVAHRLSTIQHGELLGLKGTYWSMVQAQQGMRDISAPISSSRCTTTTIVSSILDIASIRMTKPADPKCQLGPIETGIAADLTRQVCNHIQISNFERCSVVNRIPHQKMWDV